MEIWRDIKGFEGLYQISTLGRVRNNKLEIIKPYKNDKGYLKVGLYYLGKSYKYRINRLVAETFIPNPDNKEQVDHKDTNKENNSISNLRWINNDENTQNYYRLKNGEEPYLVMT